jgi:hypothetical protein
MKAAIVALIMSALELLELWGGWSFGVGKDWVLSFLMLITPLLVWLIPGWFPD